MGAAALSHTHDWSAITGKPATFTPSTHTHVISEITGLNSALEVRPPSINTPHPILFAYQYNESRWKPLTLDAVANAYPFKPGDGDSVNTDADWTAVPLENGQFPERVLYLRHPADATYFEISSAFITHLELRSLTNISSLLVTAPQIAGELELPEAPLATVTISECHSLNTLRVYEVTGSSLMSLTLTDSPNLNTLVDSLWLTNLQSLDLSGSGFTAIPDINNSWLTLHTFVARNMPGMDISALLNCPYLLYVDLESCGLDETTLSVFVSDLSANASANGIIGGFLNVLGNASIVAENYDTLQSLSWTVLYD